MAKLSIFRFIREQYSKQKPVVKTDLTGKVVVVVGANTGLGFEACKHFASMNPKRLIMGCRNKRKGEEAVSKLQAETRYNRAELWIIDLASFSSVKSFVEKLEKECDRLDILVENAAIADPPKYETTEDGWASMLQVNAIAPAIQVLLLLPIMLKTAREHSVTPRIVNVASDTHYWATLPRDKRVTSGNILEAMSAENYYDGSTYKYPETKFLNVLFTRAIQSHLGTHHPPLVVSAVNPGFCYSELRRGMSGFFYWLMEKVLALTTEEGSRQLVYAALADHEEMPGGYVSFSDVVEPSDGVIDEAGQRLEERFWSDLIWVGAKVDDRVPRIVNEYLKAKP
ncbi:retinol dehydrogenase 12 [Moniliophthora roreri MCA 2997]|uniref:Retinol dehydrogenase 12 n=2 Tax=Moniliophthora roreri TaxID=221103 RepID=V2XVR1_MONRO|nr:retinol dehydrogenase 12 [Moniliophthora roreri MCA 2997]